MVHCCVCEEAHGHVLLSSCGLFYYLNQLLRPTLKGRSMVKAWFILVQIVCPPKMDLVLKKHTSEPPFQNFNYHFCTCVSRCNALQLNLKSSNAFLFFVICLQNMFLGSLVLRSAFMNHQLMGEVYFWGFLLPSVLIEPVMSSWTEQFCCWV